jgi:hypothetical protein
MLLLPLRTFVIPRLPFTAEELAILDRPTASSFVSLHFSLDVYLVDMSPSVSLLPHLTFIAVPS